MYILKLKYCNKFKNLLEEETGTYTSLKTYKVLIISQLTMYTCIDAFTFTNIVIICDPCLWMVGYIYCNGNSLVKSIKNSIGRIEILPNTFIKRSLVIVAVLSAIKSIYFLCSIFISQNEGFSGLRIDFRGLCILSIG